MKLTEGFQLLATAPDGIKRLRELILSLAVQGKLVPQDPSDQPASELLVQIRAEKDRLIAEGKIKKDKPLPAITDEEKSFELPEGWEWVRLGEITNFGSTTKKSSITEHTWVLDLEDIEKDSSKLLNKIRFADRHSLSDKNCFDAGDILYGKLRPYLNKVIIADESGVCTTEILPIRCYGKFEAKYFLTALKSQYFLFYVNKRSYGMKMPRLGTEDGRNAPFPLPPLAEQSRIAAKVEELMALCDTLEANGRLATQQHNHLTQTLFGALAASESAHQLQENWARVADNFDLLLDRPSAIDALEQTILQLAVRGLLVPQDPSDQPASELLAEIRAEKDRLIAEGKIKKDKPLPAITEEEKPFDLPEGWEWVRFGSIINSSEAGWSPNCENTPRAFPTWGVLKVSAVSWGEFRPNENKELPQDLQPRVEYEVKNSDFLLSRANTEELVARSVIAHNPPEKLMMSDKIIRINLSSHTNKGYYNIVNNSYFSRLYYVRNASGTSSSMKNISREVIYNLPIPLPPLAEQSRIVARVESLRALCADLRARLSASQQVQTHLAEVLIEQES